MVTSVDDILEELNLTDLKIAKEKVGKSKLTDIEKRIFNIILKEPTHIDKICEISKMPASKVMSIVSTLEIQGIIKNIDGKLTKI